MSKPTLRPGVILFAVMSLVSHTAAGVFTNTAWNNDASSGIVPGQTVWAYHFGVTNIAVVNGVTVPGIGTNGNPSVPGEFSVSGIPFVFLNHANNLTALGGNGSAVMAKNFVYGGAPGLITLEGLTIGTTYTLSVYGVSFDPPTARASNFTNGTDTIYVNENAGSAGSGLRVEYTFTATATTNRTIVMPTNANTFHTYGLALRQPFLVTTNSDSGPGSLRQMIADSAALGGSNTISFAAGLSGQTILLSGPLSLNNNVNIDATELPAGIQINGNRVGPVFLVEGNVVLTALTITNGFSSGVGGGGIYNVANLTLNRCLVTGNSTTGYGGGIENDGANLVVNQSTFRGNSGRGGGGIDNNTGSATVNQCTVTENSTSDTGGAGGLENAGASSFTLNNSIVAGNTGPVMPNLSGTINQTGVNLTSGNPLLAPLGNYGGPTLTMPPLPGSPAIDTSAATTFTIDQRGSARVIGAAPDIGAVESGGLWVQNNNDAGPNSLRGVLTNVASVALSKMILFNTNLSGQNILLTQPITVSQNVSIDASTLPAGVRIDGNQAGSVFYTTSGDVILTALTITNGVGLNSIGGGGIFNTANLTVNRCTIVGNSTPNFGGGIENGDRLVLNECTVMKNSCQGLGGGGIDLSGVSALLNQCTVISNSAPNGAGGCYNDSGTFTLNNSIIARNTAPANTNLFGSFLQNGVNLTNGNPLLAPLGNYGGPTPTLPPLPGSPAIDTGGSTTFTSDQRGYPRPVGLASDIGAVEGVYFAAGPGRITNITQLANGSVRFSFTNVADASFPVMAATNINQAMSNWTQIGFVSESPVGSRVFPFTDTEVRNFPRRFYRVKSP